MMDANVPGTFIHGGFAGKKTNVQNGSGWKKRQLVLTDQFLAWFKTQVSKNCVWLVTYGK